MVLHRKSGYIEYYNRHNSNLPSNNIYSIISDGYGGALGGIAGIFIAFLI